MKEALVSVGPKVHIVDSPVPKPSPTQVLIRVLVSGSNPKDWKAPEHFKEHVETNSGDDIAGLVEQVGSEVWEFKQGDRVAAFHTMRTPGGSFAEFAVAEAHTTFRLPDKTTFEEGAAIPLAALTAALGVFQRLGLPVPWRPATEPIPLVIYGAASAVGAYALQWALRSNIHPLICVAGQGTAFVEKFIDRSKGDTVIDYREGHDAVIKGLKDAVSSSGQKLINAFDAVSEEETYQNICEVLDPHGKIVLVNPFKKYEEIPKTITQFQSAVRTVHDEDKEFGYVFCRLIGRGLSEGWFKPHPQEVVPGGLTGVEKGLADLKSGKARSVKYVFRIAETEGVGQDKL